MSEVIGKTLYLEPRETYDPCILNVDEKGVVHYSADRIIAALVKEFADVEDIEDPFEAAMEWYFYNIEGAHLGEFTPVYVQDGIFDCSE